MRKHYSKISLMLVLSIFVMSLGIGNIAFAQTTSFTDIENSYAKEEIVYLANEGIISGLNNGTYGPKETITRAQLAKVLSLSMGLEENGAASKQFTDVADDAWYSGYIGALVNANITTGTSPSTFSPNESVTREELAVFFVRAMGLEVKAKGSNLPTELIDMSQVSEWAKNSVALAYEIGFIKGMRNSDGTISYNPKGLADRQALARLAYEFYTNSSEYISCANNLGSVEGTIKSFSGDGQSISLHNGETLHISKELKNTILSNENITALENANITYTLNNAGEIASIINLELNTSGKQSLDGEKFSGNMIFDGNGATIDGDLIVNGDYTTIKNLTIKGDLTISEKVANDFYSDNVTVEGQTFVNGGSSNTVIFNSSTLKLMQLNKDRVRVKFTANSSAEGLNVAAEDSTIHIDEGSSVENAHVNSHVTFEGTGTITDVTINGDDIRIEISLTVESVNINGDNTTIDGSGAINNLSVGQNDLTITLNVTSVNLVTINNQGIILNGQSVIQSLVVESDGEVLIELENEPVDVNIEDGGIGESNDEQNTQPIGGGGSPTPPTPPTPPPAPVPTSSDLLAQINSAITSEGVQAVFINYSILEITTEYYNKYLQLTTKRQLEVAKYVYDQRGSGYTSVNGVVTSFNKAVDDQTLIMTTLTSINAATDSATMLTEVERALSYATTENLNRIPNSTDRFLAETALAAWNSLGNDQKLEVAQYLIDNRGSSYIGGSNVARSFVKGLFSATISIRNFYTRAGESLRFDISISSLTNVPDNTNLKYFIQGNSNMANTTFEYINGGITYTFTTDSNGLAYFAPSSTFTLLDTPELKTTTGITQTFTTALPAGFYPIKFGIAQVNSDGTYSELVTSQSNFTTVHPQYPVLSTNGTDIYVTGADPETTVYLYKQEGTYMRKVMVDGEYVTQITDSSGNATFNSVSPGVYAVTQKVNGVESIPVNNISVGIPNPPTLTLDGTTINITNAEPGATIYLYNTNSETGIIEKMQDGSGQYITQVADINGQASFIGLDYGIYNATQEVAGFESELQRTSTIMIQPPVVTATLSGSDINITDAIPGATIYLHKLDKENSRIDLVTIDGVNVTQVADASGMATITLTDPGRYYVSQVVNGVASTITFPEIEYGLPAPPTLSLAETEYGTLNVTGAEAGATIFLHYVDPATNHIIKMQDGSGQYISQIADINGNASFTGLTIGRYFVTQVIDNLDSNLSNTIVVPPPSVTITLTDNTIRVTGAEANATLYLYVQATDGSGQFYKSIDSEGYVTLIADANGEATFINLAPGIYYITQKLTYWESAPSNQVEVIAP